VSNIENNKMNYERFLPGVDLRIHPGNGWLERLPISAPCNLSDILGGRSIGQRPLRCRLALPV
jgi:hypothetical protein